MIPATEAFKNCTICPRNCGVDREKEKGFCKTGIKLKVASAFAHFGEEPVLTGIYGSGTIFFSGCNLGCVFCQNYDISHLCEGEEITVEELTEIMLYLQANRCHNINLVTPTHQIPLIVPAILKAKEKGLSVPIVYNCGGYEKVETLKELEGIVDIYMPDIKTFNRNFATKYLKAPDYPEVVKDAVLEMFRQVGNLEIGSDGTAKRGVLIRHLVMPGYTGDSIEILNCIKDTMGKGAYVNVMDQYFPAYRASEFPEIARRITEEEFLTVYNHAKKLGLRLAVE
ncbi:radical SAM protein [Desulfurobacterium sp.]